MPRPPRRRALSSGGIASAAPGSSAGAIGGAAVGGPASVAVVGSYHRVRSRSGARSNWQGALGINSLLMRETFEYRQGDGTSLTRVAGKGRACAPAADREQGPDQGGPASRTRVLAAGVAACDDLGGLSSTTLARAARRTWGRRRQLPYIPEGSGQRGECCGRVRAPLQHYLHRQDWPEVGLRCARSSRTACLVLVHALRQRGGIDRSTST